MTDLSPKHNEYDYLFKLVLLGSAGVGKSSIILRYSENYFHESYSATIGLDFKIKTVKLEESTIKLQIWDTAGQERYNALSSVYYKGSHGCIAVFDLTNIESFENAKRHLQKVYTDYGFPKGCVLLVGNKIDVESNRKIRREDAMKLAEEYQALYIECSAKTSEGIDDIFSSLCQTLVQKASNGELSGLKTRRKSLFSPEVIDIKRQFSPIKKKESGCCW